MRVCPILFVILLSGSNPSQKSAEEKKPLAAPKVTLSVPDRDMIEVKTGEELLIKGEVVVTSKDWSPNSVIIRIVEKEKESHEHTSFTVRLDPHGADTCRFETKLKAPRSAGEFILRATAYGQVSTAPKKGEETTVNTRSTAIKVRVSLRP